MLSSPIRLIRTRFQEGSLLPLDLYAACISRAESVKQLNAFVKLTNELASIQANEANVRYKQGSPKSLLDGIPVAVKDNFCTHQIETTCSSKMLENFVPPYNATVVQRLQDAGAVLLGKCNMDEFAMGSGSVDSIHGPTKNVWGSSLKYQLLARDGGQAPSYEREVSPEDDWHIPGGSSGGSAVAVATGAVFAALGSDTGGSTRNPAAYCGLVGLKPSYGLVSRHGLIPLVNSMDVPSILARSIDDASTVLNVIAGHDAMDSTTVQRQFVPVSLQKEVDIERITVGIPQEYHCSGMSKEVIDTWTIVADLLERAGARVLPVSLPHTRDSIVCYSILNQCEVASNMARYDGVEYGLRADEKRSVEQLYASSRSRGFNDVVRSRILAGNYFLLHRNYGRYFVQALKVRRLISADFARAWSRGVDVLLTPTTLTDAPTYAQFRRLDNRTQCATQDYCTQPANMAGCPAVSLPIDLSARGLPLSLQLIGQNFQEQKMLSVAKWIESNVHFPRLDIVQ